MKWFGWFAYRCLLVAFIFLILAIMCKRNQSYKNIVYYNLYSKNINFSFLRGVYNKYLSNVIPVYGIDRGKTKSVFNENVKYTSYNDYFDGVKLMVDNKYLIPSLESGIVVYIGNKEYYGNSIIVENNNGIDIWYGNVCNANYKLYDNVSKGDYIGEACNDYIYLVYSKQNRFLNYKDYMNF